MKIIPKMRISYTKDKVDPKSKDGPKTGDDPKMRMCLKMKTSPKMKISPKVEKLMQFLNLGKGLVFLLSEVVHNYK